jgi:hypothetical protein
MENPDILHIESSTSVQKASIFPDMGSSKVPLILVARNKWAVLNTKAPTRVTELGSFTTSTQLVPGTGTQG